MNTNLLTNVVDTRRHPILYGSKRVIFWVLSWVCHATCNVCFRFLQLFFFVSLFENTLRTGFVNTLFTFWSKLKSVNLLWKNRGCVFRPAWLGSVMLNLMSKKFPDNFKLKEDNSSQFEENIFSGNKLIVRSVFSFKTQNLIQSRLICFQVQ